MVVVDAVVDTVEGTFHGLSLLIRHALYTRCIRCILAVYSLYTLPIYTCADALTNKSVHTCVIHTYLYSTYTRGARGPNRRPAAHTPSALGILGRH